MNEREPRRGGGAATLMHPREGAMSKREARRTGRAATLMHPRARSSR